MMHTTGCVQQALLVVIVRFMWYPRQPVCLCGLYEKFFFFQPLLLGVV